MVKPTLPAFRYTHPQLPSTMSEWEGLSHGLHHFFKDNYSVKLNQGKILHAIAAVSKFENSHNMRSKLDEMYAQLEAGVNQMAVKSQQESKEFSDKMALMDSFQKHVVGSADWYANQCFKLLLGQNVDRFPNEEKLKQYHDIVDIFATTSDEEYKDLIDQDMHNVDGYKSEIIDVIMKLDTVSLAIAKEYANASFEVYGDSIKASPMEYLEQVEMELERQIVIKLLIKARSQFLAHYKVKQVLAVKDWVQIETILKASFELAFSDYVSELTPSLKK